MLHTNLEIIYKFLLTIKFTLDTSKFLIYKIVFNLNTNYFLFLKFVIIKKLFLVYLLNFFCPPSLYVFSFLIID